MTELRFCTARLLLAVCLALASASSNGAGLTRLAEAALVDERVLAVTVAVRKLRPPVPHHLDTSGVRITRTRAQLT